jgi:hypothetical protein
VLSWLPEARTGWPERAKGDDDTDSNACRSPSAATMAGLVPSEAHLGTVIEDRGKTILHCAVIWIRGMRSISPTSRSTTRL